MMSTQESRSTLYEEIQDHFAASTLIYGITELRKLAEKGKVSSTLSVIKKGPQAMNAMAVLDEVHANSEAIQEHMGKEEFDLYINKLSRDRESLEKDARLRTRLENMSFVAFEDDTNVTGGLVYQIVLDRYNRQIVVCFRGSVTLKDFIVDSDMFMTRLPNPARTSKRPHLPKKIGIHRGFVDYMTALTPLSGASTKESAGKAIVNQVLEALEKNPGFRVYTTGHSLGAALSTMCAFILASRDEPRIPKPVSCINFASPRVGNVEFYASCRTLEEEGSIRSLRLRNDRDPVAFLPRTTVARLLPWSKKIYRHVGPQLVLRDDGQAELSFQHRDPRLVLAQGKLSRHPFCARYSREVGGFAKSALTNPASFHGCEAYRQRIELSAKELDLIYWDDLDKLKECID